MSRQNKTEPKVITFYELTGIIILAISLLILFFPKKSVNKLIESEKSNYDLTIIYLKSIAQAYPENPDNWLRLIDTYINMGKIEEAKKSLESFQKKTLLDKDDLKLLSYKLIKGKYITSKSNTHKIKLLKELKKELETFLNSKNPSLWYFVLNESSELNLQKLCLKTLNKRIYHARNIDYKEVIKAFFLAKELNKNKEAVKLLQYSVKKSNNQKLFDLLKSHYTLKKEYIKIAKLYERRFLKSKDSKYFLKTAKLYLLAKSEKKAFLWLKKYQNIFLKDPELSYKIIKLYLSYQKLDHAKFFVASLMKSHQLLLKKNSKLLRISLDVMIYNNDLENATKLAKTGAENFKNDTYWLKKSLQIALWQNNHKGIKKYATLLYEKSKLNKYIDILEKIANSSNNTDTLIKIYKQKLSKEYSRHNLLNLLKYYKSLGNFEDGVLFFDSYYKIHPYKEVLKSKIVLEFEYKELKKIEKSLKKYIQIYGVDEEMLHKYAQKLFSMKKYKSAFELLDKNSYLLTNKNKELWFLYADLAFILQNEENLYKILKQMQKSNILRKSDLEKLFVFYRKKEIQKAYLLAQKEYKKDPEKNSFYRLISVASSIDDKNLINSILNNIPKSLLTILQNDSYFHLIKAVNFQNNKKNKKAHKEFLKAISIDPYKKEIHMSYLWFLLSYEDKKALENELTYLIKNFIPDPKTTYVMALGYFKLQQGTNAEKYLHYALKNDQKNWQLHMQYADILSLLGDERGKQKHMLIARNIAQKDASVKSKPYDYLRVKTYFNPLYIQNYLQDTNNKINSKKIYQLYISTLINQNETEKIKALIYKTKITDFYIRLYLALSQNNTSYLQKIKNSRKLLPLNENLLLLKKTGAQKEYESLLFDAIAYNKQNSHFANRYLDYILKKEPIVTSEFKHSNQGDLKYNQITLSYKNIELLGIDSVMTYERKDSIKNLSKKIKSQNSVSLKLYKALKNYKFSIKTNLYNKNKIYIGFKGTLSHKSNKKSIIFTMALNQNEQSSNYLALYGRKNLLKLDFSHMLNRDITYSLGYEHATYNDTKDFLGYSDNIYANYRVFIKRAYPDISFAFLAQMKNYTKNKNLPKSFTQATFNLTYGNSIKSSFHPSWRSYSNSSVFYNNHTKFGYSFLFGYGGLLNYRDYLGFEILYSTAIESHTQNYFSGNIRYLFW